MRAVAVALALLAVGCGAKKPPQTVIVEKVNTVEIKVPVAVQRVPPDALLTPITPPLPVFVAPSDPAASSALTVEGERFLLALIEELLQRIDAWKAWATAP